MLANDERPRLAAVAPLEQQIESIDLDHRLVVLDHLDHRQRHPHLLLVGRLLLVGVLAEQLYGAVELNEVLPLDAAQLADAERHDHQRVDNVLHDRGQKLLDLGDLPRTDFLVAGVALAREAQLAQRGQACPQSIARGRDVPAIVGDAEDLLQVDEPLLHPQGPRVPPVALAIFLPYCSTVCLVKSARLTSPMSSISASRPDCLERDQPPRALLYSLM